MDDIAAEMGVDAAERLRSIRCKLAAARNGFGDGIYECLSP